MRYRGRFLAMRVVLLGFLALAVTGGFVSASSKPLRRHHHRWVNPCPVRNPCYVAHRLRPHSNWHWQSPQLFPRRARLGVVITMNGRQVPTNTMAGCGLHTEWRAIGTVTASACSDGSKYLIVSASNVNLRRVLLVRVDYAAAK